MRTKTRLSPAGAQPEEKQQKYHGRGGKLGLGW